MKLYNNWTPRILVLVTLLTLALLAACRGQGPQPAPETPVPVVQPTGAVAPQSGQTTGPVAQGPLQQGPRARPSPTPGRVAGLGAASFARAADPLKVLTTQPADKTEDVAITGDASRITVQFSHPVVPLVGVAEQAGLANPLTFSPAVTGKGEWLNTSTYVFRPDNLQPSTRYTVTIAPLSDLVGQKMEAPFNFSFTTVYPGVLRTGPAEGASYISATQPITVTFNQAMNQADAQAAFSLRPGGQNAPPVAGSFSWDGPTMTFKPAQPLARATLYTARIAAGAKDAQGKEAMRQDKVWTFTTAPAPGLASSKPANGARASTDIRAGLQLVFTSPMDREGLNVTVEPKLTPQNVIWDDETGLKARVVGNWLSSTEYAVTVKADSKTRSGETLSQDVVIRFSSAPMEPRFEVGVPGQFGMYDATRAPNLGIATVNTPRVDLRLSTLSAAEALTFMGRDGYQQFERFQPAANRLAREWSVTSNAGVDKTAVVTTTLSTRPTLDPGAYYLTASAPGVRGTFRHVLIVSDVNLLLKRTDREALVWATGLRSGQPVAGLPITLYDFGRKVLAQGTTDANGLFRTQFPPLAEPYPPVFALSERNGQVVAGVGSDWSNGISVFDYGLQGSVDIQDFAAEIYTERPLYRPGQTVYFKGIVRAGRDGAYTVPSLETVPLTVRDGQGREIYKQDVGLTPFGTFFGQFDLAPGAATGYYEASLALGPPSGPNNPRSQYVTSVTFQVAEYRKPEYEVAVTTDKPVYVNGDTINATADATYFFGGPVANAQVKWRLLTEDYTYAPPESLTGFWEFTDSDLTSQRGPRQSEQPRTGEGKTDGQGKFTVQVPAALGDYPVSQSYNLEVEVTDINGQAVTSRRAVPVHKGDFQIGVRPERYVGDAKQPQRVDLVVLDTQGISVTGQALTVTVSRREWFSARQRDVDGQFYWTTSFTDTVLTTLNATTDNRGAASVTYTPPQTGAYRIAVEGKDRRGNTVRSATTQWISGGEYVAWRAENNDRIGLVADKKQYNVGETARIFIPAPFTPAEALLTVERGDIREVRRLRLDQSSTVLDFPLIADHVPNVYISVTLVKGGDDKTLPQFRLGMLNLNVTPTEKLLDVSITPEQPGAARPGQTVVYNLVARDRQGRPVQAEFSVGLVDKAIYSLADDRTRSPVEVFYSTRPLGVVTAATLVRNVNRLSAQLSAEGKGGGGGGGGLSPSAVRADFRDTAFWKADVVTDAQGRARVEVKLPDNLTTWTLTAIGATKDTLVGMTRLETLATKELLVRPALPRFLVQGDQLRLSAVVQNNTDRAVEVNVQAQTRGLDGKLDPVKLSLPARGKALAEWDVVVGNVDDAETSFSAEGGGLSDAVTNKLPVYRAATPETVGTAGVVTDRAAEVVRVPAEATGALGGLTVVVNPSLAAVTADGLRYLESYQWDCSEQVVSRFLPSVASVRAAQAMSLPMNREALAQRVSLDSQRLYSLQNSDGGWGWWKDDPSSPLITAWAVLGLHTARETGFAVDNSAIDRALSYLSQYLDEKVDTSTPGMLSQRAFVLYALGEVGRPNLGRSVALYDLRNDMSLYGQALLLMALQRADAQGQAARVRALSQNLTSMAVQSATGTHWEESVPNPLTMNTHTRTTAIVLMALSRVNSKDPNLPNVVRWLMSERGANNAWSTTQETAWSVLALTEYAQGRGDLDPSYRWSVNLNGTDIKTGTADKTNLAETQRIVQDIKNLLTNVGNNLTISKEGQGSLYYTAHLTYYVPAEQVQALARGVIVGRQYVAVDGKTLQPTGQPATSARVGDYVQVKLSIVAPASLHYLIVEDPLPAGFEAVDVSFKTSSQLAEGPTLRRAQQEKETPRFAGKRNWPGLSAPYWSYWSHNEIRDNKVALFATELQPGAYEYTYLMRATAAGQFKALPATAYEMYFPETFGRSAGALFPVTSAE